MINKILKQIFRKILCSVIYVRQNRVTIIDETSFSGSNSYALYSYILSNESECVLNNIDFKIFSKNNKRKNINEKIGEFYYKASSKVIVTTHSMIRYKSNQKLIQLWHGIPLKSMGLLDKTYCEQWIKNDKKIFDDTNIIIATSELYVTLLNSTTGQERNKYKILGYPRNDYLIRENENKLLISNLFQNYNYKNKTIFYIPTFKMGYGNRIEGNSKEKNIFGFEDFSLKKFSDFLVENNINFILKFHPFEEVCYKKKLKNLNLKNIYFLNNEMLINEKRDLYEYLSQSDMLITDYSSVYFDYLITRKPILFINVDEQEYRRSRGFLLEPYEYWTPGPKVATQELLEKEILNLLMDNSYYANERSVIMKMFHDNIDSNNSKRVWEFIKKEYLKKE